MKRYDYTNAAITAYLDSGGGDPNDERSTLIDLIADLMHASFDRGFEPHIVASRAMEHYNEERAERIGLPTD